MCIYIYIYTSYMHVYLYNEYTMHTGECFSHDFVRPQQPPLASDRRPRRRAGPPSVLFASISQKCWLDGP